MKISTKGRYALRILADIAEQRGRKKMYQFVRLQNAKEFSDKYLEGIVSRLSSAGLVKSGTW